MECILVDYEKILDKSQYKFPKLSRQYTLGIVFVVPKHIIKQLLHLPLGKERVKFINMTSFKQYVKETYQVLYNEKKNVCILPEKCYEYLSHVLEALYSGFKSDTKLWISLDLKNTKKLQIFVQNGFKNPYLTEKCPNSKVIDLSIALSKKNTPTKDNVEKVINQVFYMVEEYEKRRDNVCVVYAQFLPTAIRYLKQTSKIGYTVNKDGSSSQKELSGQLLVKDIKKIDGKYVYCIDVNMDSIRSGEEEECSVSGTRYNFHSHPKEAYIRHDVHKAWPSMTDYLGFLTLGHNTIFHCVATLEGLYILSFGKYWIKHLEKVSKSFIKKNYKINHKEDYTSNKYVEKVNSILYNGHPIFNVQFLDWKNVSNIFSVSYKKTGINCLATEQSRKNGIEF